MELSSLTPYASAGTLTAVETVQERDHEYYLSLIAKYPEIETGWAQNLFDRLFAAAALIVTAPVMLIVAIAIKLDSPGPALFIQTRVGRGGRCFRFLKFRTYYQDSKERFPELFNFSVPKERLSEFRFKVPDDPRATRVGRLLRKSTLDELPNFWNVLTGDLALVGPRPEIPEFLQNYTFEQLRIFSVLPGITGHAQVSGRALLTFTEICSLNLEYLKIRNFALDLKILALTFSRVFFGHGAF